MMSASSPTLKGLLRYYFQSVSRTKQVLLALACDLTAFSVWACNGPDVYEHMKRNTRYGWLLFGLDVLITAALWIPLPRMSRVRWVLRASLVMLVMHPGWWMSSERSGDCGETRVVL